MGNICGGGNPYKGSKEEQDINNRIEKQLRQQRKELETEIKMLLLGMCLPDLAPPSPTRRSGLRLGSAFAVCVRLEQEAGLRRQLASLGVSSQRALENCCCFMGLR